MARPGELTPAELATIAGGEQLALIAAAWFAAADAALRVRFGFGMVIRSPYGGYRTRPEHTHISPSTSVDLSDHPKGRAIDIDNQRAFRTVDEAAFVRILAAHGWRNENTYGRPFVSEPWHFRNTNTKAPARAETDHDMKVIKVKAGSIALIGGLQPAYQFTNYTTQGFLIEALAEVHGQKEVTPDQYATLVNFQNARAAEFLASLQGGAKGATAEQVADELAERLRE